MVSRLRRKLIVLRGKGGGGSSGSFDPAYNQNTLSNGNLTATGTGGNRCTLTKGGSTGKFQFEIVPVTVASGNYVGIATRAANLFTYPGSESVSFGFPTLGGTTYFSGTNAPGGNFPGAAAGDVIDILYNQAASTVNIYVNNVLAATNTGITISGTVYGLVDPQGTGSSFTYRPTPTYTYAGYTPL